MKIFLITLFCLVFCQLFKGQSSSDFIKKLSDDEIRNIYELVARKYHHILSIHQERLFDTPSSQFRELKTQNMNLNDFLEEVERIWTFRTGRRSINDDPFDKVAMNSERNKSIAIEGLREGSGGDNR